MNANGLEGSTHLGADKDADAIDAVLSGIAGARCDANQSSDADEEPPLHTGDTCSKYQPPAEKKKGRKGDRKEGKLHGVPTSDSENADGP